MKTDQHMRVVLPGGIEVEGFHKSGLVNLTSLWGQAALLAKKANANLHQWLHGRRAQQFIQKTSELIGVPVENLVEQRGKGRAKATWAHINIALAAMSYLSPEVEALVVHEFVRGRLFQWREEGGDGFIDLNATLALTAEDVFGKPAHKGHYVTLAKIIKERVGVKDWNLSTHQAHQERTRIEDRLSTMLKVGVVKDWDHLKELAKIV